MTHDALPARVRDHPRRLVVAAVARYGHGTVVRWCEELVAGRVAVDDPRYPRIEWLGGTDDWPQGYWGRTWGARGLLHGGPPARPVVVLDALTDEHWRVREMALKVVLAHGLDDPDGRVVACLDDASERVRVQAGRVLAAEAGRG